jgi:hypothetical protein
MRKGLIILFNERKVKQGFGTAAQLNISTAIFYINDLGCGWIITVCEFGWNFISGNDTIV